MRPLVRISPLNNAQWDRCSPCFNNLYLSFHTGSAAYALSQGSNKTEVGGKAGSAHFAASDSFAGCLLRRRRFLSRMARIGA